LLKFFKCTICD